MKKSFRYVISCSVFILYFLFILKLNGQVAAVEPFPPEKVAVPSETGVSLLPTTTQEPVPEIPSQAAPPQAMTDVDSMPVGAETVEMPPEKIGFQGNWVKKREWLKEAYNANTKIQEMVVSIQKSRKGFYDKYAKIDKEMDEFYKGEGIEHGKAEILFADLNRYIEKRRKKELARLKAARGEKGVRGEYQIKLDIMEEEVKSLKTDLEQLKLDIKSIWELDKSLDERLKILDEQIEQALKESSRARDLSNKIWYVIDDKKAREIFYQIKGDVLAKVQGIQSYISIDLAQDFDQVLQIIRSHMSKVAKGIKDLEERDLIIRNRAERIREIKLKELEEAEAKKIIVPSAEKEVKKLEKVVWFRRIYNFVVDVFAKIYNWIKYLFGIKEKKQVEIKELLPAEEKEELPPVGSEKEIVPETTVKASKEAEEPSAPTEAEAELLMPDATKSPPISPSTTFPSVPPVEASSPLISSSISVGTSSK